MTENNELRQAPFEHFKNIFVFLFKKQYKDSFNELLAFLKDIYSMLKEFYLKHLKGQYVVIKGRQVPRTAIAILCLVLLYLISPMSCLFNGSPDMSAGQVSSKAAESIDYYKDNIKITNMHKCGMAACGELEYDGEDEIEIVRIIVGFYTKNHEKIHDSYVDAPQLASGTRVEFTVPAEEKFAYYKLVDVQINPADLPDEEDTEDEED